MLVSGLNLALINIGIFSIISLSTRYYLKSLKAINLISYWWLTFTILTGIWESYFIYFYDNVSCYSKELLFDNKHVWNTKYPINYLMPHKFSYIFYSEYAAYADREYMVLTNKWSRTIEGTHEVFCGVAAFFALLCYISLYINKKNDKSKENEKSKKIINKIGKNYYILLGVSMGSQLLNSVLYMAEYYIQTNDKYNVNYNTTSFPTGKYLIKRPFMYVNIFGL